MARDGYYILELVLIEIASVVFHFFSSSPVLYVECELGRYSFQPGSKLQHCLSLTIYSDVGTLLLHTVLYLIFQPEVPHQACL